MNWRVAIIIGCVVLSLTAAAQKKKAVWKDAASQQLLLAGRSEEQKSKNRVFPRTVVRDTLQLVVSNDWTSGFFPGNLWFLYERTKDEQFRSLAKKYTDLMYREPTNGNSHDIGFKVYNSYGNGYRLTGDTAYRRLIIQAAGTLTKRFNPKVGCIKSWDFNQWEYPVIIDNMMNLELLFAATRLSGDSTYYRVAVAHANTTMKNHFRADNSSFHVLSYDTTNGNVLEKTTHQGFAPGSAWARGQAWGLYGYTMCYRETHDPRYLEQAEKIAAFIINHPRQPADGIPYWDYDLPSTAGQPRDASAASITASALYELAHYSAGKKQYRKFADKILNSLIKHYRAPLGSLHGFILDHSTGNKPVEGEVDVPLIYADYYFLEALLHQ